MKSQSDIESKAHLEAALNGTQKNIIVGTLSTYLDDIAELPPSYAIEALKAIVADTVTEDQIKFFSLHNCWSDIAFIRRILTHPCPQNRSENYPYFGAPADSSLVVYKDAFGKPAYERRGLLSLTTRNDSTAEPVTQKAVVSFIHELIDNAIAGQTKLLSSSPSKEGSLSKEKLEIIEKIKSILTSQELTVIPALALLRLETDIQYNFIKNIVSYRKKDHESKDGDSEEIDLDFSPDNIFLDQIDALLLRGVSLLEFARMDVNKQNMFIDDPLLLRLLDRGIEFDKIARLTYPDLKSVMDWVRQDYTKMLSLFERREVSLQQLNDLIDSKLSRPSNTLDM